MARKVSDVVVRAREVLQDEEGVRYSTGSLISHLLDALHTCRTLRPDLFLGKFGAPLPDTLSENDPLPVPDHLFSAISLYVAGMAELRDDEFAIDNRAMTLSSLLSKKLITGS
jgi:hypothetical protein